MSENVLITPGSGDTVGADDIGSVKYQRIKIIKGVDGTNSGDISDGNPLPVSGNVTISQTATLDVNLKSYIPISVTVAQSSTSLDVNLKSYTPLNFTASQSTASNLKTEAHLFDSSTNGISSTGGSLDVNIKSYAPLSVTIPQFSALNVTASQSTASNLKVESHLFDSSTNGITSTGGGLDVNLRSYAPLNVTVSQSGSTLDVNLKSYVPVNFTASQSTASNLKMEAHLFDSSTNGISSTGGSIDVNLKSYAPLSMTVSQATATNLKTQAESYQGGVAVSTSNPLFVTLAPTAVVTDSITNKTPLYIKVAYTSSQTGATVLTPTSGKKAVITDIVISASASGSVYLFDSTDSASTAIGPVLNLGANGGWDHSFAKMPFSSSAVNNVIKYTSGAGSIGSIWLEYYEI